MASVATANVAKIALGWTYLDTPIQAENVFHVKDTTGTIFTSPETFCGTVFTQAVSHLIPRLSGKVRLNQVGFEDVRTVPYGGLVVSFTPVAGNSSYSGLALPSDVCICIKKTTGNMGRSGRGRWYWPLGDAAVLAHPDEVTASVVDQFVTALEGFQAGLEAAVTGLQMGIVSTRFAGADRTAGLFQQITGWSVGDYYVDNQRRRLLGRGR